MKTLNHKQYSIFEVVISLCIAVTIIFGFGIPQQNVMAANPPTQQIYFVSLPEDDLLKLFDDDDVAGGTFADPISPIRSITSISISSSGTWVYYDQWEDGGYETLISEPGSNVYSTSNLDGTQIWGDGVLANGCPPNINNVPNACLVAADDQFDAGDVIILDNNVEIVGSTPGPYSRNASAIFFDGRDKFGSSFPVAVTRGAFPVAPGSVMAGGNEMLDTSRWGLSYEAPLGEDTLDSNTNAFEDVRWFIMAGVGGATINVDANGDGDVLDANDLNNVVLTQGAKRSVDGIRMGATLTVVSGNPVQVNSMTADVDDTFEFRWDALLPREAWSNNYLTPVGTFYNTTNFSGCTEVEVYNPNATTITINYDFPGGSSPDGSFTVASKNTATGQTSPSTPVIPADNGARFWSAGEQNFLPISVTDCTRDTSGTDGRLFDWGSPLFPITDLTDQALVGWAPGCSNESLLGICDDTDIANKFSRNVVFITPLANTTLYVDTNGSGITCPGGAGAEKTIAASALVSYRVNDDPTAANTVRDDFASSSYSLNTGTQNWTTSWVETGDNNLPGSGSILITGGTLRITGTGTAGDFIQRQANLSGQIFADLTFALTSSGNLESDDQLAVDVSNDGGSTWRTLVTYSDDPTTTVKAIIITPYIASNTRIRFRSINDLASGEYWNIDQVQIKYATNGDYDMTGARIATCDGTVFASAWGQDPALSGGNDDEALDLGTGISPFGTRITLDKTANKTEVAVGGAVTYSFAVQNQGAVPLSNVTVTDNRCSPAVYVSGDTNTNNLLDPQKAETWIFTCTSNIFVDTTNVAIAQGEYGTRTIFSAPDQWTVRVIQDAVIGNYVWLDEDGDGDQDAGESGIPNMKVELCSDAACTTVLATTYTDSDGGYLFDGLNAGSYFVRTTPATGLNPTYDENGVGTPNITAVTLVAGQEYMTADFGYNWSTPTETNTNTGTGAIGDRVWIDANGDGTQDPNEIGLYNIPVTLFTAGPDGLFGTSDDVLVATKTTDHNGNYIFDNLPADAYVVKVNGGTAPTGYTQTGDPDENLDNITTSPILLAPGDVYVNADFGYQPTAGTSGSIGDMVWMDANRDNSKNTGEPGIPGVTVALIKDLNGNGVWDAGEPIIATDTTDENGIYGFSGLPVTDGTGSDDYLVWVNDTDDVLGELSPVYDVRDGATQGNPATGVVTGLEISAVSNLSPAGVSNADFAYAPPGQNAGEGLIGDTVWYDRDSDGQYDPGEGMEGIRVTLTEPGYDGVLGTADDTTRSKFTDENGNYSFGDLEPSLSYRITVDGTTLPAGLTNIVDPDGTLDGIAVVNLGAAGGDGVNDPDGLDNGINLGIDFGYRDTSNPNSVGGTIWNDFDSDGTQDASETQVFPGVTVALYRDTNGNGIIDSGDQIVGTTTTDSNGDYIFERLPDGNFIVDVTDDDNVLDGYWHSLGTQGETADGQSKIDPYAINLSGGENRTTVDFGYYSNPASVGNFIWDDRNDNGVQDPGEPGLAGVKVTLTVTYPNSTVVSVSTTTDADGFYRFDNLMLDEDFDGVGTGEPSYQLSVTVPNGYTIGKSNIGSDSTDSDGIATGGASVVIIGSGTNSSLVMGAYNPDYDFGLTHYPSTIGNYIWLDEDGDGDQDAGEAGIANVKVDLWGPGPDGIIGNADDVFLRSTVTDTEGGYLFKDVVAGQYQVKVDPLQTALTGMVQTTITGVPGVDFGNQVLPLTITVPISYEYLSADFGFNYQSSTNTNTNVGTGSIGDRIWSDTDGDGIQDAGEIGVPGVTVTLTNLGADGILGTPDDTTATTTTNATGNYVFDDLPAGAYKITVTPPAGYTQTGDPDHFGVTAGVNDNTTTAPILLAPGDVFVNADFGYQPPTDSTGAIGDRVWYDANGDGVQDSGEYGIPGVTVALIDDLNGNGVWDTGEPVIAQDVTDSLGIYGFAGLPTGTDADYLVWVNDTNNVLNTDKPTYDADGVITPNISSVQNLTTAGVTNQDFGYVADGFKNTTGTIGDTVYLDRNNNGAQDAGDPGIEGVVVDLYNAAGTTLIATTVTDENGNYYFTSLPPAGYVVKITNAGNFAPTGVLNGMTYRTDPDGGTADGISATVTITGGTVNLAQDFGLRAPTPGVIGGTIWDDSNADGTLNETTPVYFAGVTVDLYDDLNGDGVIDATEPKVGTVITDAIGNYSFTGLPAGNYLVDVTDTAGVLTGKWHSVGATPGADNNSQVDPYPVSITAGQTNTTADFGYYSQPASVGNIIWNDVNDNGIQDAGEVGIADVTVSLTITYPDNSVVTLVTTTDTNGNYRFDNLLLDEDFDGAGLGEPTYELIITVPTGFTVGLTDAGDDDEDSDGTDSGGTSVVTIGFGTNSPLVMGTYNPDYDFGLTNEPTAITLPNNFAVSMNIGIQVTWETDNEKNIEGFKIYRVAEGSSNRVLINQTSAKHTLKLEGDSYQYMDTTTTSGVRYIYYLEVLMVDGEAYMMDPSDSIMGPYHTYMPLLHQ